jgi:hypothetical protein
VLRSGDVVEWQGEQWQPALKLGDPGRPSFAQDQILLGPVYDSVEGELTLIRKPMRRRRFAFLPPNATFVDAQWQDGAWKKNKGPTAPSGTSWLLQNAEQEQLVVTTAGVFLRDDAAATKKPTLFGVTLPFGGSGPFVPLGPNPPLRLAEPFSAAIDLPTSDVVLYGQTQLIRLSRNDEGAYQLVKQQTIEGATDSAVLTVIGSRIVLGLSDGRVLVVSSDTLEVENEYRPAGKSEPFMATSAADGKWFAVLFHNGKLLLGGADGQRVDVMGNDISAVAFDGSEQMLVADRTNRVTAYRLGTREVTFRYAPSLDILGNAYYYFVLPFYTVFPKPGELGDVVKYVLTDQETDAVGPPLAADLRLRRRKIDIYGPIASSLAFVVVMLSITCVYVERIDM